MQDRRYAALKRAADYSDGSVETLRRMIARGELTEYRLGRVIRIDLDELDRVMAVGASAVTDGAA